MGNHHLEMFVMKIWLRRNRGFNIILSPFVTRGNRRREPSKNRSSVGLTMNSIDKRWLFTRTGGCCVVIFFMFVAVKKNYNRFNSLNYLTRITNEAVMRRRNIKWKWSYFWRPQRHIWYYWDFYIKTRTLDFRLPLGTPNFYTAVDIYVNVHNSY